jgi:hypothetical protein
MIGVSKRGAACKHSRVAKISANVCVKRKNADETVVLARRATLLARVRDAKHGTRVMVNRHSIRCAAAAPVAAKKLCTARSPQHVFGGQTAQNGRISAQLIRQRAIERCRSTPPESHFRSGSCRNFASCQAQRNFTPALRRECMRSAAHASSRFFRSALTACGLALPPEAFIT